MKLIKDTLIVKGKRNTNSKLHSKIRMHSKHKAAKLRLFSTVQLICTVNTKQQNAAFSFLRDKRKKHMGPIHNKLCIFCYQTTADCVLIKTQLQPRKQTNPRSIGLLNWLQSNRKGSIGSVARERRRGDRPPIKNSKM